MNSHATKPVVLTLAILFIISINMYGIIPKIDAGSHKDGPFYKNYPTAEHYVKVSEDHLAKAQDALVKLIGVKGKRSVGNTLKLYDELLRHLDAAGQPSGLIQNVHPDGAYRDAAEKMQQKVSSFATELSLNRDVYDAIKAIGLTGADAETKYFVERTLRDYRLAGVDKDEATRKKIKALSDELVEIGQTFARNIRDDKRTVKVASVAELDGLPEDYIKRHAPAADGSIALTIDYPDAIPVFTYAKSEALRKRMYMEFNNRAFPANIDVLNTMIAKRYELANLLGFPTWAEFVTADKMIRSGKNIGDFVDRIAAAARTRMEREYKQIVERKKKDMPDAKAANAWESGYWQEIIKREQYQFDGQSVRPYFQYDKVKQGVLDVTSKLFGVTYKRIADAPVWHPSVECYEMFESGKLIGRFYYDMHPRDGKYNHAAQFGIRTGVAGVQIPEAVLVCNFPGGEKDDPGLMEYDDVLTFFHEFGHLLHSMFAGHRKWIGIGGISTEWDFVEAPSQLLEEWVRDPQTLATFATHYQTGEPIPAPLVAQMIRANEFGKGLQVSTQMYYAKLSLSCYNDEPSRVNTNGLIRELAEKYRPFKFVDGTHMQCSFGHLDGYSAIYYTYMWSLVIAKDFFSKFDRGNLLASNVATEYRKKVLAAGGSKPAAQIVEDFLGRPFNEKAWQAWLERE